MALRPSSRLLICSHFIPLPRSLMISVSSSADHFDCFFFDNFNGWASCLCLLAIWGALSASLSEEVSLALYTASPNYSSPTTPTDEETACVWLELESVWDSWSESLVSALMSVHPRREAKTHPAPWVWEGVRYPFWWRRRHSVHTKLMDDCRASR